MNSKKVTMVVINYNDKKRIQRAIDSCVNQTYKNVEVIVVDDGSDDETKKLYKPYKGKIKLIERDRDNAKDRTPSAARNDGINVATGEYICFLDSDNYYNNSFVEEMMKDIVDVAMCNWDIVGLQNYSIDIEKVWNMTGPILQNYLQFQHVDHQCLLIKKALLVKVGYYDTRLPRSQDCDLIVRLMLSQCKFQHVSKHLFTFEKHEEDQQKVYGSVYGKTLWTLKNDLPCNWLMHMLTTPQLTIAYYTALKEFSSDSKWETEFNKSEFKKTVRDTEKLLNKDITE